LHQKYYNNGPFIYKLARRSADVRDGLSNTMFIGETTYGHTQASMNSWAVSVAYLSSMRSTNNLVNTAAGSGAMAQITSDSGLAGLPSTATGAFSSNHPQGANFAFGDAHITYISNMIDLPTYQALSTIAGAENITSTSF
jgi:prepilin-type processing-associated H-X9-DG protein